MYGTTGWLILLIYVGGIALIFWIAYLVIRTAVKNGILRADEVRARRAGGSTPPD